MSSPIQTSLVSYKLIFFDFDGVIKDSVEAKADAFESIFSQFGSEVASRVRSHHEQNGGMSRYDKIPLYLIWANQKNNAEQVSQYCELFAQLAKEKVLQSPWVAGVRDCLSVNHQQLPFILVTATPEEEIVGILSDLEISSYFREVHGAPKNKVDVVANALERWHIKPEDGLFIGDSSSDWKAAKENGVNFLLRRTAFNRALQQQCNCPMFDDFTNE